MDYHDMYIELFRIQTEVIKELETLVTRMQLVQLATEEMAMNMRDGETKEKPKPETKSETEM